MLPRRCVERHVAGIEGAGRQAGQGHLDGGAVGGAATDVPERVLDGFVVDAGRGIARTGREIDQVGALIDLDVDHDAVRVVVGELAVGDQRGRGVRGGEIEAEEADSDAAERLGVVHPTARHDRAVDREVPRIEGGNAALVGSVVAEGRGQEAVVGDGARRRIVAVDPDAGVGGADPGAVLVADVDLVVDRVDFDRFDHDLVGEVDHHDRRCGAVDRTPDQQGVVVDAGVDDGEVEPRRGCRRRGRKHSWRSC